MKNSSLDEIFWFVYETHFSNMTNSFLVFVAFSLTCNSILNIPRTWRQHWGAHVNNWEIRGKPILWLVFILFCFVLFLWTHQGRTKQPSDPAPSLTKPLYFQEVCILPQDHHLHLYCERTQTCLTEENEAGLSQRGMDRVWCCELGKMWGRVAEGASLRAWGISENGRQTQHLILRYVLGSRTLGHNRYFNLWEDSCVGTSHRTARNSQEMTSLTSGVLVARSSWDCQLEHLYTLAPPAWQSQCRWSLYMTAQSTERVFCKRILLKSCKTFSDLVPIVPEDHFCCILWLSK